MKKSLDPFLSAPGASIRQIMRCIDQNARGIAMIVDAERRLIGTVTDGDLRRALLQGATLDSLVTPFICREFIAVGIRAGRSEVLDLMRARSIGQVPIVDEDGRLAGIHVLREIIGAAERPNAAVIMAGGRGQRLRPLTDQVPKPMIRVAGRPILERLVLHLVGYGIRRIHIAVRYLGHTIQEYFGDGSSFGCKIQYLEETKPLGTGGALSLLPAVPAEPLLVLNGDLITQADIGAMFEVHEQGGHAITVGAHEYSHTVPYGCIELDGQRIVRLEEKPVLSRLINAGIYIFSSHIVRRVLPDRELPITALIEESIAAEELVGAFQISDDWIDVGHQQQLGRAQRGYAPAPGREALAGGI